MAAGDNLQRQHRKLAAMGADLIKKTIRPFPNIPEVRRCLAQFSGVLRVHAAMEEEAVYPELLGASDPEIRRQAETLHADLAGLYKRWDEFMDRWHDTEAIAGSLNTFRFDLTRVLTTLGRRMKREDRELYPLVQRHAAVG